MTLPTISANNWYVIGTLPENVLGNHNHGFDLFVVGSNAATDVSRRGAFFTGNEIRAYLYTQDSGKNIAISQTYLIDAD